MRAKSAWIVSIVGCLVTGPAFAQVSFQQNSYGLAVPPFGGYAPEAGITFGFGAGGVAGVQQNGFGQAVPPFGGFAPDAGLSFGFGSAGFGVNFSAAQGSRSSLSGQSVTGTLSNGVPMSVAESSQTPFVLGTIPVVGQGGVSPLTQRVARLRQGEKPGARGGVVAAAAVPKPEIAGPLAQVVVAGPERKAAAGGGGASTLGPSSAERPARSVAEIRRAQQQSAADDDAESEAATRDLIARATQAAADGKTSVARVYYQQALRRATGRLKEQVQERLDVLR